MMHLKDLKRKKIALLISGLAMNTVFATAMAADAANTQKTNNDDVTSLTDVTVESKSQTGDTVSRAKQEVAPNLINVTSAEEIRKLPDVNAGEAVRRLPGISMTSGSGEGRFINIRGLDSDLSTTTFGGVRLPPSNTATPTKGGRAIDMGTIPAGMVGSITVTKTNKPEQDAEALGGTIEITPKSMPLSGKPFLEGKIGAGREQLRGTNLSDVSLTGGIRFGGSGNSDSGLTSYSDKPFSLVGTYSRYEDKRGFDDLEEGYLNSSSKAMTNLDQRAYNNHRTRYGGGGELTYQPNEDNKWFLRYYDFGFHEHVNRNMLSYGFKGTPTMNPDGSFTDQATLTKTLRDEYETINSKVFTVGGENQINATKIDYHVAHTIGSDSRPYDNNATFSTASNVATVTYNNVASPSNPQIATTGVNPADPNGYTLTKFQNIPYLAKTNEWSGVANVATSTHWTSAQEEEFKAGISARLRTNDTIVNPLTYSGSGVGLPVVPLSQVITGSPVTFGNGQYQNGYNIDPNAMNNLYAQGTGFVESSASDALSAAAQRTHNIENVYAAYGQEQMTFGKLSLLGGLRVEATHAEYDGNAIAGNTVMPVAHTHSYKNLFPSLQARYELAPASIVRASFSSTIARPGFQQTSASTSIVVANNQVTTGNPDLKPILANNIDLSFEQYLSHGGIVSVGVFNKAMKDYVISKVDFQTFPNSGIYSGLAPNTTVTSFANVSSATARGLELNYRQKFDFLPGILSGLGAGFNWTGVNSSLEVRPGESKMLPMTARNTYNATLFWERNGLNVNLAANYVGRSLFGVGKNSMSDTYTEAALSADFGASYQVTKNYGLFLSIKNLLNTPLRYTQGTSDRLIQRETYGQTVEVGATFGF